MHRLKQGPAAEGGAAKPDQRAVERGAIVSNPRATERGVAMIVAIFLVLVVAVVAAGGINPIPAGVIKYAGRDRIAAARMSVKERGLACAEAGIQYGRRLFGCNYKTTGNWNDYLSGARGGRYDPTLGDVLPTDYSALPMELKGSRGNTTTLDTGTDLDGDGQPDFWVSIRDDDDERPEGAADNRTRDNNLMVYLRSECINPAFAVEAGGVRQSAVIEVLLAYLPGSTSPYGKATSSSDFPEASASGPTVVTAISSCD
jgi:hypothetical protein